VANTPELDDIVRMAGGAVELRVRQGWWVWEVPRGREVRIAISPQQPVTLKEVPDTGYWVCYHLGIADSSNSRQFLADRMRQRLVEVTGGVATPLSQIEFLRLGEFDAAEVEFSVPVVDEAGTTMSLGRHLLVHTPWGLFEFHAQFPANRYAGQAEETERLLRNVKLAAPKMDERRGVTHSTSAAAPIHGSWKAFRSRLYLASDGRIEISTDRPQLISPPSDEAPRTEPEALQGQFRAEQDLLFIEWRDGSKLNFRWKLKGGELLLTDHAGQISQLRRLAE